MELWVRSQRKTCLMKINKIRINKDEKWQIESFNEDNYTTTILGEYKSKKRALEVLDEIQNSILGILTLEDIEEQEIKEYTGKATFSKITNNLVYIMPEE